MIRRFGATVVIGVAVLLTFLVALAAATPAAAAQLTVNSTGIVTDTATPCTRGELQATAPSSASATTLTITAVPANCQGRALAVYVLDAGGNALASQSGTTTAGSSTTKVTGLSGYNSANVDSVVVFIDGWWIDTVWTAPTPPTPATGCVGIDPNVPGMTYPCTLSVASNYTSTNNGYTYTNTMFNAVTSAPIWRITVDLSSTVSGFTGMSPVRYVGMYQNIVAAPGYSCSGLPLFVGQEANPSWGSSNGELVFSDDPNFSAGNVICDA